MRDMKHLLDELHITVLVISFEPPATLRRFHWFTDLPFATLTDPSRHLYTAFGLQTRPLQRLFDRATVLSYLRGFLHGRIPPLRHADVLQLGGDVVLNRAGTAVFVHRSKTPADRPPVYELLRILRAVAE
ncbi:MAG: hypothetical protein NVS2B16_20820 [Chloroflexota bacterium]